jgi:hypothetical protein
LRACQRGTSFGFEPGASEIEKGAYYATLAFPDLAELLKLCKQTEVTVASCCRKMSPDQT